MKRRTSDKATRRADENLSGCHICQAKADGNIYHVWAGFCVNYQRTRQFLSNRVRIQAEYRNLKKYSVFVCADCAAHMRRMHHLFGAIGWGVAVFGCLIGAVVVLTLGLTTKNLLSALGILAIFGGLSALLWVPDVWQLISPGLKSPTMDRLVLERTKKFFRLRNRGDSFFTPAGYRVLFKKESSEDLTAEDLLEMDGGRTEDRHGERERKPRRAEDSKECPFCGGTIPRYAQACSWCKKILV
jgi:hypothetical protein